MLDPATLLMQNHNLGNVPGQSETNLGVSLLSDVSPSQGSPDTSKPSGGEMFNLGRKLRIFWTALGAPVTLEGQTGPSCFIVLQIESSQQKSSSGMSCWGNNCPMVIAMEFWSNHVVAQQGVSVGILRKLWSYAWFRSWFRIPKRKNLEKRHHQSSDKKIHQPQPFYSKVKKFCILSIPFGGEDGWSHPCKKKKYPNYKGQIVILSPFFSTSLHYIQTVLGFFGDFWSINVVCPIGSMGLVMDDCIFTYMKNHLTIRHSWGKYIYIYLGGPSPAH